MKHADDIKLLLRCYTMAKDFAVASVFVRAPFRMGKNKRRKGVDQYENQMLRFESRILRLVERLRDIERMACMVVEDLGGEVSISHTNFIARDGALEWWMQKDIHGDVDLVVMRKEKP